MNWRVLNKIQRGCRKTLNVIPLWIIQSWFSKIRKIVISTSIIHHGCYFKLPGTNKEPKTSNDGPTNIKPVSFTRAISSNAPAITSQRGKTLHNRNVTTHSFHPDREKNMIEVLTGKFKTGLPYSSLDSVKSALDH